MVTEPPALPRYAPTIIYCCPRCGSDLDNEGLGGFWCPSCRQPVSGQEVAYFDEGQPDD